MDSTNFPFEKNKYDTIIVDPPYTAEANHQKNNLEKGTSRWKQTYNGNNENKLLYTYATALLIDRIFQYAYKNKTWLIYFYNRPLQLSRYTIIWVREKEGLGWNIGRNAEFIHLVNYAGMKAKTVTKMRINEVEFIPKPRTRTCAKPTLLYKKIFVTLNSKKIFDPFAGWGNSVIAAKDLELTIDALDKDQSLQDRFDFLNNYQPSKLDDFLPTQEAKA